MRKLQNKIRTIGLVCYLASDSAGADLPGSVAHHRDLLHLGQRCGHLSRHLPHKLKVILNVVVAFPNFCMCLENVAHRSQFVA
jgi:hypothetical protein